MRDDECVSFLQWALPHMQMRWPGFRKVRGQVCKRLQRRIKALGVGGVAGYREYLEENAGEWPILDGLSRVSISRFYRDKQVFAFLEQEVLPALAQQAITRGEKWLKVWSVGCSSGEEPYTVSLLWRLQLQSRFPSIDLHILASDAAPNMIRRATAASYRYASVKNLPESWRDEAFTRSNDCYALKPEYRRECRFIVEDVRQRVPQESFDLILCRNLVFTYYDEPLQRKLLERMSGLLRGEGALVIGVHEKLPAAFPGFAVWSERLRVYRKSAGRPGNG